MSYNGKRRLQLGYRDIVHVPGSIRLLDRVSSRLSSRWTGLLVLCHLFSWRNRAQGTYGQCLSEWPFRKPIASSCNPRTWPYLWIRVPSTTAAMPCLENDAECLVGLVPAKYITFLNRYLLLCLCHWLLLHCDSPCCVVVMVELWQALWKVAFYCSN